MWAEYAREEEKKQVYETEDGFFSYQIIKDEIFVRDFFVKKEKRGTGIGQALGKEMERIGRENNCKVLSGIVHCDGRPDYQTRKVRIYIEFGFRIFSCHNGQIVMTKELV